MEVFFIRRRKMLLFGSFFMLFYFFYQMYGGIESINANTGKGIGMLMDASISLFVSIYFFINVRKANKKFREENAAANKQ